MHGFDVWSIQTIHGQDYSHLTTAWRDIAQVLPVGERSLAISRDPVRWLRTMEGEHRAYFNPITHTLGSAYAFRQYLGRAALLTGEQELIGYECGLYFPLKSLIWYGKAELVDGEVIYGERIYTFGDDKLWRERM